MRIAQLCKLAAQSQGVSEDQVDEALKDFGSMESYIRTGLGINDAEVRRLRAALLE